MIVLIFYSCGSVGESVSSIEDWSVRFSISLASFSACLSSSETSTFATAAISSPFLRLISRTPCVARPITLSSDTSIRIIIPDLLIIIKSSLSVTSLMAIKLPVFSVILIVFTPSRPRGSRPSGTARRSPSTSSRARRASGPPTSSPSTRRSQDPPGAPGARAPGAP